MCKLSCQLWFNFQIIQTFTFKIILQGTFLHLNQAKTLKCYNTLLYPLKNHGNHGTIFSSNVTSHRLTQRLFVKHVVLLVYLFKSNQNSMTISQSIELTFFQNPIPTKTFSPNKYLVNSEEMRFRVEPVGFKLDIGWRRDYQETFLIALLVPASSFEYIQEAWKNYE